MAGPEQQHGNASDPFPSQPPISSEHNLEFLFSSDPRAKLMSDLEWRAELLVKAKDLPSLMKNGFHWDETNIQEGEGYFGGVEILSARALAENWWRCARVYLLQDKTEDPQWEAKLTICARGIPVLSAFRIAQLSVDKIDITKAWDKENRHVYYFSARRQHLNFNAYYDDKPLQGRWPWPKEGNKGVVQTICWKEQETIVFESKSEEEWEEGWIGGQEDLM